MPDSVAEPIAKIDDLELELSSVLEANEPAQKCFVPVVESLKSIASTSVNPERCFSTTGWFNSRIRNRLGFESLDAMVFLKYNLKNYI